MIRRLFEAEYISLPSASFLGPTVDCSAAPVQRKTTTVGALDVCAPARARSATDSSDRNAGDTSVGLRDRSSSSRTLAVACGEAAIALRAPNTAKGMRAATREHLVI